MHTDAVGRFRRLVVSLIVLAFVASLTPGALRAASPSITLSPNQVQAGATVLVAGSGFDKKGPGSITFDGSPAGMPIVQANGVSGFSVSLKVPAAAVPGAHVVRAATNVASASATLTVLATSTSTSTSAPASTSASASAADPNDIGSRGPGYPTTVSAPTGQKPQSKLWTNDGAWWGVLFDGATGRFVIQRFDRATSTWIATPAVVDQRANSSADALWDGSRLFVISHAVDLSANGSPPTSGDLGIRLMRYSYSPATRQYTLDSGYPVTLANAAVEAAVLDEDGTGTLWATWTYLNGSGGRNVLVTHSGADAAQWVAPYVLPVSGASNLALDDISALVRFDGRIGVMWSNQNDGKISFATHADGAGDRTWDVNPALQGPQYADDHISIRSLQADPAGRVVAVVKTSLDVPFPQSQQPQILLLLLDRNGAWQRTTFGVVADDHTRPIVVVDSENGRAYVFATGPRNSKTTNGVTVFGGTVYYKSTSLSKLGFGSGLGTAFIRLGPASTSLVNDPTSTKQAVNSSTGLLVLASDDGARSYMQNSLTISRNGQAPPTANNGAITAVQGQTATGSLSATDPNGDPLTYAIVTNGGKGTATITNAATGAFQYVPAAGASGSDSFTFKANDGTADSNIAIVSVSIVAGSGERGTWRMEEGSGTTIADSSGQGNTGTLIGAPSWTTGWRGLGLRLNGTTQYATVPNASGLNIQGPITLAAWVKPGRVGTQYVIKKAVFDVANGYELSLSTAGKVFFRLNQMTSLNTYRVDSVTSYPGNGTTWMHIAATYDGSTIRLYINGVQEATAPGPAAISSNSQRVGIGAQPDGVSPFSGTLDDVRIWARALSATEIQSLVTP